MLGANTKAFNQTHLSIGLPSALTPACVVGAGSAWVHGPELLTRVGLGCHQQLCPVDVARL